MIIETIVSTIDKNSNVNFSPFGIKRRNNNVYISPYIPSKTLSNLVSTKHAVINYTDNVSFFVNCIIGNKKFKKKKCKNFPGFFLENCLSYEQVVVKKILQDTKRPTFICKVQKNISVSNFQGHNRSKAAIIEACILASRVNLLDENKIFSELEYLKISVEKTAGPVEKRSWEKILKYINEKIHEK